MNPFYVHIDGIKDAVAVEFYVERDRAVRLEKKDLIKVYRGQKMEYYASVDVEAVGRGNLIARVEFTENGEPFFISGFTGVVIPYGGEGKTISVKDYKVSFNKVDEIPLNDGVCFYGIVNDYVPGYEFITADMVKALDAKPPVPAEEENGVSAGDKLVVAIPKDRHLTVYKGDGLGGKMVFSSKIMGANGLSLMIDDIEYLIYGEFVFVDGVIKIYIE